MVFSSPFFLSVFLPTLLLIYIFLKIEYRNYLLLLASFLFYSWGEPKAFVVMLALIAINYLSALIIEKKQRNNQKGRGVLAVSIILNLSALFFYKYLDFAITNINVLCSILSLPKLPLQNIVLPIGISFYCLQAMSYTIDVYRQEVTAQKNIAKLALYISLFPQLVAGPIVRYSTICKELEDRSLRFDDVIYGSTRFVIGLAKKVLLADTLGFMVDTIYVPHVSTIPTLWAWLGCIAYTLQIYYDFSGYSDMAIGLGRIFGFHFLENFTHPYSAVSIKDFWRRWHISLSSWLKDYCYIPLGGNRISPRRTLLNKFTVFLLCGIWHGAAWNFAVWGMWHGLGLILEDIAGKRLNKIPKLIGNIYVLLFVSIGLVIFRSPNLTYAVSFLKNMFLGNPDYNMFTFIPAWSHIITISNGICLIIACIIAYPIKMFSAEKLCASGLGLIYLAFLFTVTYCFAMTSSFSPFLYFRF